MRLQSKIVMMVFPLLLIPLVLLTAIFNYYAQEGTNRLGQEILSQNVWLMQDELEEYYMPIANQSLEGTALETVQQSALGVLQKVDMSEGMSFFVMKEGRILYHPDSRYIGQDYKDQFWYQRILEGTEKAFSYRGLGDTPEVLAYWYFQPWDWYVCVTSPLDYFRRETALGLNVILVVMFFSLVLVGLILQQLARYWMRPLYEIMEAMRKFRPGMPIKLEATTADELGVLGEQLAAVSVSVKDSLDQLEQSLIERNNELQERSRLLEKIADVAREVAMIHDSRQLLQRTVHMIADKFDYYHVGLFLVDPLGEAAVMQAASSSGGQRMVARSHRRRLGEGIVGYVAQTGEPRIALDVEGDAVFRASPDLPLTRSEMALPLKGRGRVLGVLDVQSVEGAAFTNEDIAILQTLAEQVALAIENARLLEASRQALSDLEELYGQRVREAWQSRLSQRSSAYLYRGMGMDAVPQEDVQEDVRESMEAGRRLSGAIRLRDQQIGSIVFWQDPERPSWTEEERLLLETVSTQIGLALENARLIEETRTTAARERLMGEISAQLRTSTDVDTILQTTLQELGTLLGASGLIRLETEEEVDSRQ